MKALLIVAAFALAAPAVASETFSATFLTPDGGVSAGSYSGLVNVTVSGTGQSLGAQFNDAFYLFDGAPFHPSSYYQLTFGTAPLVGLNPAQEAVNFIVGGLPAYQASHVYNFVLNTGLVVPGQLHFGVSDGNFSDNSGAYSITLSALAAPEPGTWAMMLGGFGMVGAVVRRRQRTLVRFG